MGTQKLYTDLASWWPLLSAPEDYAEEARFYARVLMEACKPDSVLELGSGGGNNASHMKRHFQMTLVDPSPGMLAVSRELNPECEHIQGDMRTARLGRDFDAVFVHDAVMYMTTLDDLRLAMQTAYVHCKPGGAVLFAPDYVRETFRTHTDHGGHDGKNRAMRFVEWKWDPDPGDTTFTVEYGYLLRMEDGTVTVEHDRHLEGLFPRSDWMNCLAEAGFEPERVQFNHSEVPEMELEVFVGKHPNRQ